MTTAMSYIYKYYILIDSDNIKLSDITKGRNLRLGKHIIILVLHLIARAEQSTYHKYIHIFRLQFIIYF